MDKEYKLKMIDYIEQDLYLHLEKESVDKWYKPVLDEIRKDLDRLESYDKEKIRQLLMK